MLTGKSPLALGAGVLMMVFGMQAGAIGSAWNLAHAAWLLAALLR